MHIRQLHRWDLSPTEAMAVQHELAARVVRRDEIGEVRRIAGVDVAAGRVGERGRASVVILEYPSLTPLDIVSTVADLNFPYVPGLLSFRELPAVLAAFERIEPAPDLVVVDGQGIAHPRRFGIASHLGVVLDLPTIGCAKSILRGHHGTLGEEFGAVAPLVDRGEVIGAAVRTRPGVKPVYVSLGHRIDLDTAIAWTLRCCRGYRLPEPTRLAHLAAGKHLELPLGRTAQAL